MPIFTKRWDEPKEPGDGLRLLVTRYRPRGVSAEKATWDGWCVALAPSKKLHAQAYGKEGAPLSFELYRERYLEEMKSQSFFIEGLAKQLRAGETITLLCSSACVEPTRCHRTLLKGLIEEAAAKLEGPPAVTPQRRDKR